MSLSDVTNILKKIKDECVSQRTTASGMYTEYHEEKDQWFSYIQKKHKIARNLIEDKLEEVMTDLPVIASNLTKIINELPEFEASLLKGKKNLLENKKCSELALVWTGDKYGSGEIEGLKLFLEDIREDGKLLTSDLFIAKAIALGKI
ncbi:MAG TPA: hypothetical protein VLE02_00900 [Nitrosarchaeum sp.]|nr:hypothetical protein [Nitrosarchaeum sp.]